MSYRLPLATTDDPGVPTIGSGLEIINGVLIPVSVRNVSSVTAIGSRTVTLQTTATVGAGEAIDVRSEVTIGSLTVANRSLILFLA